MKRPSILVVASLAVSLIGIECALRLFLPLPFLTIGDYSPENAKHYGWGYAPHSRIVVADPDTGKVFSDQANSRGWRDIEHKLDAKPNVRRILILGDSNTFGANVPAETIYPRLLERLISSAAIPVEVVSMAYGGWSTSQELEALVREGLAYKPDLVVVQFTSNDLGENAYIPAAGVHEATLDKPFYHLLDERGHLVRIQNPNFRLRTEHPLIVQIKTLVARFEILKRSYVVYDSLRSQRNRKSLFGYPLDQRQIEQAQLAFGLEANDPIVRYLTPKIGQSLDYTALSELIGGSAHVKDREGLLAVLGDVWINQYWDSSHFQPAAPDPTSYEWRLYHALMRELRARVPSGIPVLLLSDHEQGYYEWQLRWYRIASNEQARLAFFSVNDHLSIMAAQEGIEFVPTPRPHVRFRLDPHPNAQGHEAMAKNLADYILSRHFKAWEQGR
ncbi:MAG: SGNH/GDSL hydrolase family protein [Alphaproteobacteria bacterium]|nr:SGNH/GDSL hydrolase family protein [Alphaproteobacteria bacterium]